MESHATYRAPKTPAPARPMKPRRPLPMARRLSAPSPPARAAVVQQKAASVAVDERGMEAFVGWGKGVCLGFSGRWAGAFRSRGWLGLGQDHYLRGRVFVSQGRCRSTWRVTFEHSHGAVLQQMRVTGDGEKIWMRGTSYKGVDGYSGSYSLDTFKLRPSHQKGRLNGTFIDLNRVRGSISLRRL